MRPQTIQIFLPDGHPTSIREAEITNRLVRVQIRLFSTQTDNPKYQPY